MPESFSVYLCDFMSGLLQKNPQERLGFGESGFVDFTTVLRFPRIILCVIFVYWDIAWLTFICSRNISVLRKSGIWGNTQILCLIRCTLCIYTFFLLLAG